MKIISYYKSDNQWWFRILGYGLSGISVDSRWVPFSIRYGFKKNIKLFGYYIQFLKK